MLMNNKKWYAILLCGVLFCSSARAVSDERSREITRGVVQIFGFWITSPLYYPTGLCYFAAAASAVGFLGLQGDSSAVLGAVSVGTAVLGTSCAAIPTSLLYYGVKNLWGRERPNAGYNRTFNANKEDGQEGAKPKTLQGAQQEDKNRQER